MAKGGGAEPSHPSGRLWICPVKTFCLSWTMHHTGAASPWHQNTKKKVHSSKKVLFSKNAILGNDPKNRGSFETQGTRIWMYMFFLHHIYMYTLNLEIIYRYVKRCAYACICTWKHALVTFMFFGQGSRILIRSFRKSVWAASISRWKLIRQKAWNDQGWLLYDGLCWFSCLIKHYHFLVSLDTWLLSHRHLMAFVM